MIWFGLALVGIGLVGFAVGFFFYHDAGEEPIGLDGEHKDFGRQLMAIAVSIGIGALVVIG
jgi:hypothetical protein